MTGFGGFPAATRKFLDGIAANNDKEWFEAHRALYDEGYVGAGRAFVETLGPALRKVAPEVQYEPKINGSIGRVNRDVRFSKDKRPYKDHLDLFFWHGDKKGWNRPGFFLRLTPKVVWVGTGMHHFEGDMLDRYRDAVVDDSAGKSLEALEKSVARSGYEIGFPSRKQVPRGYDKAHPRAKYLLYESLYAHREGRASEAYAADFGINALKHFKATWPVGKWIEDHLVP